MDNSIGPAPPFDAMPTDNPETLWRRFLTTVRPQLSTHVFDTWIRSIRCSEVNHESVTLAVRDRFSRDWLTDHFIDVIRDNLSQLIGQSVAIEWQIDPGLAAREELPSEPDALSEENNTVSESADLATPHRQRLLNPRYKFDSFVCGPSNEFAFAACRAVAEKPGGSYNPLFLFGRTGLGKTHLLSAIGREILTHQPHSRIIYTSAEQYSNDVVHAVLKNRLEEFRSKYRQNCDVLLIDDIQLIAGKERTQHEFFHIFNTLYDSQRLIVVTSDKLPHEIPEIEERLRSRFQWGLIADIQPPEVETRIAILKRKAELEQVYLPDDVAVFLAESIRSNVRELEGALVRVVAHASLTKTPINIEYARRTLSDVVSCHTQKLTVEGIQKIVAGYFQVRIADLKSRSRHKTLVLPRQVAMYLARKHSGASYPDLGSRFGKKDHTTVMNACKRVESLLKSNGELRGQVHELERKLEHLSR